MRAKVKYYKSMYEKSVEERTDLRSFFNAAKTEAVVQKTFIQNLMNKIRDLKHYKDEYNKILQQTEVLKHSASQARTETGELEFFFS